MEAARIATVLATETSAQEAITTWDSAKDHVRDLEDRDALVEREARERVSRVEARERVSYPVPREWKRSLHTCAQDVSFTRIAAI
jgi:hypothetical protein